MCIFKPSEDLNELRKKLDGLGSEVARIRDYWKGDIDVEKRDEFCEDLDDLNYRQSRISDRLSYEISFVIENEAYLEHVETYGSENERRHIDQILRADDGAQEENHARLLEHSGEPQPVCPWCKNVAGVVYRQDQQYLLRCPCRVIYVQADSPIAAARKLQLGA